MPVIPCPTPPPQPVQGVVQFDNTEFLASWPEFTGISSGRNQIAFNLATVLLSNSCCSVISDANLRLTLLYVLTAHIGFLLSGTNDGAGNVNPPYAVVGRLASATEGSVTAAVEWASEVSDSEAFYLQSKYGALFWQMTAPYRIMLYFGAPSFGPNGPGFPFQDWEIQ